MNQPIEERIKRIEQRQEDTDKRVTQQTEEIKAFRTELDPGNIHSRLDNHAELMREQEQTLTLIYNDVGRIKTDIGEIKQALERQEKRFDAIAEVQKQILDRLPPKQ